MKGFVTRSEAGLRPPRSFSRNITPRNGGAAVHWGGPSQNLGSHARCYEIWRSWQNFHMNTRGWADIAYNMGFCNHGYVFAGRGLGVRSAAQGTNSGNQNYHAFVWIGGSGDTVTQDAYSALRWCINEGRKNGAGRHVLPHYDFTGSSCPGSTIMAEIRKYHNKTISTNQPKPQPPMDEWEKFMASLSTSEKQVLKDFANHLAKEGQSGIGASFARQFLLFNREERGKLREFLDAIDEMDSSPRGQGRALSAMWREAGARGWDRDLEKFKENRIYSADELENKETL